LCCTSSAVQAASLQNNVITVAIEHTPSVFNPFSEQTQMASQFRHLFFDPLFRWGPDQKIENRLVKSWQRINEKTVRFQLRKNIYFSSGHQLTSQDVIWSLSKAKKKANNTLFNNVENITIHDQYRFDIRSRLSTIQLLDYLTNIFILDSAFYEQHPQLLNQKPRLITVNTTDLPFSGTGPYRLYQYNPLVGIEVIANPTYWDGAPAIKLLRFMQVNKAQSRLFALLANDVQISAAIPSNSLQGIQRGNGKAIMQTASPNAVFLSINDKLSPALKSEKLRMALHLAIDQAGMLKHVFNGAGRLQTVFASFNQAANGDTSEQPAFASSVYDLDAAKALLKKMTLPKQLSLLVKRDQQGDVAAVAQSLKRMLKRIDIEVSIEFVDADDIWNKKNLYFDLTLSAWHTQLLSRDNIYDELFINSELSDYLRDKSEQGRVANNFSAKSEYFELLLKQEWIIPLFSENTVWGSSQAVNLQDIFSVNGIPYWSLLAPVTAEH